MKIFIAADHTGILLKAALIAHLRDSLGHDVEDLGAFELAPGDDYPDVVAPCAAKVAATEGSRGIVIGGSGQGEAMVANRQKGVRAAVFYGQARALGPIDAEGAPALDGYDIVRLERLHNDANVLSLGARFLTPEDAKQAAQIFMDTPFSGAPRHARRIAKF